MAVPVVVEAVVTPLGLRAKVEPFANCNRIRWFTILAYTIGSGSWQDDPVSVNLIRFTLYTWSFRITYSEPRCSKMIDTAADVLDVEVEVGEVGKLKEFSRVPEHVYLRRRLVLSWRYIWHLVRDLAFTAIAVILNYQKHTYKQSYILACYVSFEGGLTYRLVISRCGDREAGRGHCVYVERMRGKEEKVVRGIYLPLKQSDSRVLFRVDLDF